MSRFKNKRVLVTGGTRGIGRAAALAFSSAGARVVVAGSTAQSTAAAVAEFDDASITGVAGDIGNVNDCRRLVQNAIDELQGLDILVNSAGVFQPASIEETDEDLWDRIMNINVRGSYFCSRAAVETLRQNRGCIVHLGSESGVNGYGGSTAYCASKGAIVNLTRSMAMELAPEIRVNAVCPGVVDTDMARRGFAIDGVQEKGIQQQRDSYPLNRVATADEIAASILYLASDDSRFITGESLVIDGGATVGK
ncbi:hypothetical protein AB833_06210 [Chromatiales bacterium (ex Bugula neritina AB1)]|nr:hypothetical protein AB833_06210 [Chromatiales bacterium (ex Bugula neritina AB1)]